MCSISYHSFLADRTQITTNHEVKTSELQWVPRCAKHMSLHSSLDEEPALQQMSTYCWKQWPIAPELLKIRSLNDGVFTEIVSNPFNVGNNPKFFNC